MTNNNLEEKIYYLKQELLKNNYSVLSNLYSIFKNESTALSVTGTLFRFLNTTYCSNANTASSSTDVLAPVKVNLINFQISECFVINDLNFSFI